MANSSGADIPIAQDTLHIRKLNGALGKLEGL